MGDLTLSARRAMAEAAKNELRDCPGCGRPKWHPATGFCLKCNCYLPTQFDIYRNSASVRASWGDLETLRRAGHEDIRQSADGPIAPPVDIRLHGHAACVVQPHHKQRASVLNAS